MILTQHDWRRLAGMVERGDMTADDIAAVAGMDVEDVEAKLCAASDEARVRAEARRGSLMTPLLLRPDVHMGTTFRRLCH